MSPFLLLAVLAPIPAPPPFSVVESPHAMTAVLEVQTKDGLQPAGQMARAWWSSHTYREEWIDAEGRRTVAKKDGRGWQSGEITSAAQMLADALAATRRPDDELSQVDVSWTLSDPAPFGNVLVPRTITIREDGHVTGVVRITKLEAVGDVLPNLLDGRTEAAQALEECQELSPPHLVQEVQAEYSLLERRARHQGLLQVLCTIDARGRVSIKKLVHSTSYPTLDDSAMKAIRRWTYEPARCGAEPRSIDTLIHYSFDLDRGIIRR